MSGSGFVVHDLRVAFGDAEVVHGVALEVRPGSVTALVGESGSGKTISALSSVGMAPQGATVAGSARLDASEFIGRPREETRLLRASNVGMIFQDPGRALNPLVRIEASFRDVLRVREDIRARQAARDRMLGALCEVGLSDPERIIQAFPHQVSGGELQRVVIALALTGSPKLLIADEPTSALDVSVQRGILDLIRSLVTHSSLGVLLITHDMGVVRELADDVVVLHNGRVVEHGPVASVLERPAEPYTRELLAAVPTIDAQRLADRAVADDPGPVVAEVHDVSVTYRDRRAERQALAGVSVTLARGEVHGLVGESGSGKSTIGRALLGLAPISGGSIALGGVDLESVGPARARSIRAQIGVVFQDHGSSLNPRRTVGWSIAEPLVIGRETSKQEAVARVAEALERVRLAPALADRFPHELSGGQRQRVAIARALIRRPTLLIADEPTSALDVTVQASVLDVLRENVRNHDLACLFISHDLAVVAELADRVTVLRSGRVVETGPTADVVLRPTQEYTAELLAAVPRT